MECCHTMDDYDGGSDEEEYQEVVKHLAVPLADQLIPQIFL